MKTIFNIFIVSAALLLSGCAGTALQSGGFPAASDTEGWNAFCAEREEKGVLIDTAGFIASGIGVMASIPGLVAATVAGDELLYNPMTTHINLICERIRDGE